MTLASRCARKPFWTLGTLLHLAAAIRAVQYAYVNYSPKQRG